MSTRFLWADLTPAVIVVLESSILREPARNGVLLSLPNHTYCLLGVVVVYLLITLTKIMRRMKLFSFRNFRITFRSGLALSRQEDRRG